MEVVELCKKYRNDGVVAIDLAGDESLNTKANPEHRDAYMVSVIDNMLRNVCSHMQETTCHAILLIFVRINKVADWLHLNLVPLLCECFWSWDAGFWLLYSWIMNNEWKLRILFYSILFFLPAVISNKNVNLWGFKAASYFLFFVTSALAFLLFFLEPAAFQALQSTSQLQHLMFRKCLRLHSSLLANPGTHCDLTTTNFF